MRIGKIIVLYSRNFILIVADFDKNNFSSSPTFLLFSIDYASFLAWAGESWYFGRFPTISMLGPILVSSRQYELPVHTIGRLSRNFYKIGATPYRSQMFSFRMWCVTSLVQRNIFASIIARRRSLYSTVGNYSQS